MKLMIDVLDEEYNTLSKMSEKEKVNELSYYERAIANGTVITDDCISRSKLKEEFLHDVSMMKDDKRTVGACMHQIMWLINNAPTIGKENKNE